MNELTVYESTMPLGVLPKVEIELATLYGKTGERLWEKLEFLKRAGKLNLTGLEGKTGDDAVDRFCTNNPVVYDLTKQVEEQFEYQMSRFLCSWAIMNTVGNVSMTKYNKENGTNLRPRA